MKKVLAVLLILFTVFTVACGTITDTDTSTTDIATTDSPVATTEATTEATIEATIEATTEATTEATRIVISIAPDTDYSHEELLSFIAAAESYYNTVVRYEDRESTVVRMSGDGFDDTFLFNTTVKMNYDEDDFRLYMSSVYDYGQLGVFEYAGYYTDGMYYSDSPEGKYRAKATCDEVIDTFFITGDDFASMFGIDVTGFQLSDITRDEDGNYVIYLMNIDADQLGNLDANSYLDIAEWYGAVKETAEVTEIYMRYTMTADGTFIRSILGAVMEIENSITGGYMEMSYEHSIELIEVGDDVTFETPANPKEYIEVKNIKRIRSITDGEG